MKSFTVVGVLALVAPIFFVSCIADLDDFEDPMLNAARDGRVAHVESLLDKGFDPNHSDYFGNTPLAVAAFYSRIEVVRTLIERGVDVNAVSRDSRSALTSAAEAGSREIVEELLKNGADPNMKDGFATPPIVVAAYQLDVDIIRLLVNGGADLESVDGGGFRAIHRAIASPKEDPAMRLKTVKELVRLGAKVDARREEIPNADSNLGARNSVATAGCTALELAVERNQVEIIEFLRSLDIGPAVPTETDP